MPLLESALLIKGAVALVKLAKAKAITAKVASKIGAHLIHTANAHGISAAASSALTGTMLLGGFVLTASVLESAGNFIEAVKVGNRTKAVIHLADLLNETGGAVGIVQDVVGQTSAEMGLTGKSLYKAAISEMKDEAILYARKKAIGY